MSNLINQKDSRWLQLETCREFQRNKCSRSDNECKFAHPTSNVEVQNGRVTACYDSIKVCLYLVCFCLFICLSVLIECHQKAGVYVSLERNNYVKQGKAKKQEVLFLEEEHLSFSTSRGKQGLQGAFSIHA